MPFMPAVRQTENSVDTNELAAARTRRKDADPGSWVHYLIFRFAFWIAPHVPPKGFLVLYQQMYPRAANNFRINPLPLTPPLLGTCNGSPLPTIWHQQSCLECQATMLNWKEHGSKQTWGCTPSHIPAIEWGQPIIQNSWIVGELNDKIYPGTTDFKFFLSPLHNLTLLILSVGVPSSCCSRSTMDWSKSPVDKQVKFISYSSGG